MTLILFRKTHSYRSSKTDCSPIWQIKLHDGSPGDIRALYGSMVFLKPGISHQVDSWFRLPYLRIGAACMKKRCREWTSHEEAFLWFLRRGELLYEFIYFLRHRRMMGTGLHLSLLLTEYHQDELPESYRFVVGKLLSHPITSTASLTLIPIACSRISMHSSIH